MHRVDHAHHESGSGSVRDAAQQDVARDGLIERGRSEAVGPGKVEDAQRPTVVRRPFAFAPFDRDAGVVSHLLAAARQAVEQCGLAAIGDADQRNAQRRFGDDGVQTAALGERGAGVLRRELGSRYGFSFQARDPHGGRFGAAQCERRTTDADHQRIANRPHARDDFAARTGHET